MSDSLIVDWLNENEERAYPLRETANRVSGALTLNNGVILDAQLIYSTTLASVRLTSLVVSGTTAVFNVSGSKIFTVDKTLAFPQYVRLADGSLLVVGSVVSDIADGTYTFTNCDFEDSVWYEWNTNWVGVNQINFKKGATDLIKTGAVLISQGLQTTLTPQTANSLYWSVGRNEGDPLACETVTVLPDDCSSIISYINGAIPNEALKLQLNAGANVVILEDPADHRLYVGLVFKPNDICPVIYSHPVWA